MMLVRTRVAPSPIEGVGLFADEPIPHGAFVWEFNKLVDIRRADRTIQQLGDPFIAFAQRYAYRDWIGGSVFSLDDSRFMNHSDNPNTHYDLECGWATRDIAAGEEITCDYRECGVAMPGEVKA